MDNTKLTSVKILEALNHRIKVSTVNNGMTLQKLTNRAIDMYLTDEKFREKVETNDNLIVSSSKL